MYDVAVIGGGPVGSRVAYKLAEMGRRVIVLEEKPSLDAPVCCTGIIGLECVKAFGIESNVIVREASSARVFSPSGKLLHLKRGEPQACIVDRTAFNLSMARRAEEQGAEYVFGNSVTRVDVGREGVKIGLGRDGMVFDAKVVALAAGAGSRLVERLGFGKADDFAMGAQALVHTRGLDEVEVYLGQKVAPGLFGWLVPLNSGRALVGLMTRRRTAFYARNLIETLAAQGKVSSSDVEISLSSVPLRPLPKTYSDRIIVVGSAAGQVKPLTGGGIYYGLICADIASECLNQALEAGSLSAGNLAKYEKMWQKRLGREIAVSNWSRKLYELLSDHRIDSIIDIIKANGIDKAMLEAGDVTFDWHGKAVLKLLGHRALAAIVNKLRLRLPPVGQN